MYQIKQLHSVFCDALLTTAQHDLLFCSLWGRDSTIQQLKAMITLPTYEQGINSISLLQPVKPDEGRFPVAFKEGHIRSTDTLTFLSARQKTTQFGEMIHFWLFDVGLNKPDMANKIGYVVRNTYEDDLTTRLKISDEAIWPLLKNLSPLPLNNPHKFLSLLPASN